MKNIIRQFILILLVFTFACSEDFLTKEPLSDLSPENTYTSEEGLQTVLDASIKGYVNQWNSDVLELMFNQNMSDVSVVGSTDKPSAYVDLRTYATPQNGIESSGGCVAHAYKQNYYQIRNCNTLCDYIDQTDWTDGEEDEDRCYLLGSAYFIRALFYMQLTMEFGNVPFVLTLPTSARTDYKVFYMQGIWDQMIADLEYAVKYMKPRSEIASGYPPVDAAKILLAKYYMLNKRFQDAEDLMDEVIYDSESSLFTTADIYSDSILVGNNENPYNGETMAGFDCNQAADPINSLHCWENSQRLTSPECIWAYANTPDLEGSMDRCMRVRTFGPNFVSTNLGIKAPPTGSINGMNTSQSSTDKQMLKFGRSQGFCRPTNYAQYDIWNVDGTSDRQDYRHKRGNWFDMDMLIYDNSGLLKDEATAPFYGTNVLQFYNDINLCVDSIRNFYGYPLYKLWAKNTSSKINRQDGGETDIYLMREAEAYLVRAEARAWQGDYAGTAEDLNIIRARANARYMYTAADVAAESGIGAVLDERARELSAEEYRHDELVRMSVIFAKTGKDYKGKTYSIGDDIEVSLSESSFYYDRMMEKNNFFSDEIPWATYSYIKYTIDPMHIFWPVMESYIEANVSAVLNQTTGYNGYENNITPLTHVVQTPGTANIDPMKAIGER